MDDRFGSAWIGNIEWPTVLIRVVLFVLIYVQISLRTIYSRNRRPLFLNHNNTNFPEYFPDVSTTSRNRLVSRQETFKSFQIIKNKGTAIFFTDWKPS